MAVKIDLTDYYPVKVRDDVNWSRLGEYCVKQYIDEWEDFMCAVPIDKRRIKWCFDNKKRIVYFNSLAAQYDCNLIFGGYATIVISKNLNGGISKSIFDWLDTKFGAGSSIKNAFCYIDEQPKFRWRQVRHIFNKNEWYFEIAFSDKNDALQFKLVWG
jgi:hypothetical protein